MTGPEDDDFVRRAEEIYASQLRAILEPQHKDEYVAIEPESGNYFLGQTLSDAARAARQAYPDRLTHAMRVGHKAALRQGHRGRARQFPSPMPPTFPKSSQSSQSRVKRLWWDDWDDSEANAPCPKKT